MWLYADMFSGISGDMFLGALFDLGVPKEWLTEQLNKVLTGFEIKTQTVFKNHLKAVDLTVEILDETNCHRHYRDIKTQIEASPLSAFVKEKSLEAFHRIALAESGIHGKDIETVHFHEVGGVDSMVDIIGAFLGIEYLKVTQVYASAVPLGSGFVECAHGTIPVPVPATVAILKDTPVKASDAQTEIVTPTGAAIIKTLCRNFGPMPEMILQKSGYGSGKRDIGSKKPNLLRLMLGKGLTKHEAGSPGLFEETVTVINTSVDDMSPEVAGYLMEILMEKGALDVCFVPVQMKKNRPGVQLEVLCRNEDKHRLVEILLAESTTIGVRCRECQRFFLAREQVTIDTRYGPVEVKKVMQPSGQCRYIPEYEKARAIAREKKMALKDVYHGILLDVDGLDRGKHTG